MAFTVGVIIGKIMIIIYLVIGFICFWKFVIKHIIRFVKFLIRKNKQTTDNIVEEMKKYDESSNSTK